MMEMMSFETHLESVIRPAAKLHVAVLVVEGEPGDVDGAGGEKDARGDVGAEAVGGDHHVGWVGSVKCLTGTEKATTFGNRWFLFSPVVHQYVRFPQLSWRHLEIMMTMMIYI